jgi:hypothetical protein
MPGAGRGQVVAEVPGVAERPGMAEVAGMAELSGVAELPPVLAWSVGGCARGQMRITAPDQDATLKMA